MEKVVAWDWSLQDNDCCQYIRKTGARTYEMIECIWLDTTEEDKAMGLHEYVIVTGNVNLDDLSDEDIAIAISPFGYKLSDFDDWDGDAAEKMIAECYLEEELMSDEYIIAERNTFDEVKTYIEQWISEHKLTECA